MTTTPTLTRSRQLPIVFKQQQQQQVQEELVPKYSKLSLLTDNDDDDDDSLPLLLPNCLLSPYILTSFLASLLPSSTKRQTEVRYKLSTIAMLLPNPCKYDVSSPLPKLQRLVVHCASKARPIPRPHKDTHNRFPAM